MRWSVALFLMALVSGGCERKAPGPDECRRFAMQVNGATQSELLEVPTLRDRVDDVTRQCLTTPYDRKLLACVETTGRLQACSQSFERRKKSPPVDGRREQWFVR